MKNVKSLFRRTPANTLKQFFELRVPDLAVDFDWSQAEGKLAMALDAMLMDVGGNAEAEVRAELDDIHDLSEGDGWLAIDELCRAAGIDVPEDGGAEGAAFFLAMHHRSLFERAISTSSFYRFYGGQKWTCFRLESDRFDLDRLSDADARAAFIDAVLKERKFDRSRHFEPDWFHAHRQDAVTCEVATVVYLTLYLQERPVSDLTVKDGSFVRALRSRVAEVIIAMNPAVNEIEICAKGGQRFHDPVAEAFGKTFLAGEAKPVRVKKRKIDFDVLKRRPSLRLFPVDRVESASVVKLSFFHDSLRSDFQHASETSEIYDLLDHQYGSSSPLKREALITGATIKIRRAREAGKTLTIDLGYPNRTTLRNQTEQDRKLCYSLLERWGILPIDEPLIEAAE